MRRRLVLSQHSNTKWLRVDGRSLRQDAYIYVKYRILLHLVSEVGLLKTNQFSEILAQNIIWVSHLVLLEFILSQFGINKQKSLNIDSRYVFFY